MTALSTSRWKKFGHDRLYVSVGDGGARVGWIDLTTGQQTIEMAELTVEFSDVVQMWLEQSATPCVVAPALAAPVAPSVVATAKVAFAAPAPVDPCVDIDPAPPAWADLSDRRAGELVKQKAAELRAEAPVKNLVARVLGVHTDARAYAIGGRGEAKVGKKLDGLPDGWHSIHSVPVGERGSDIDHVVIGPGGVFTLNTKHHPNGRVTVYDQALYVNGHLQPYLRKSRFEAERAGRLLSASCGFDVAVTPVLVFVGADVTIKERPDDVRIVYREGLKRWLKKLPVVLDDERVAAIYEMARRDVTWRTSTSP